MRATQQLQYAIYGVFDLAYNGGPRPTRIQEVAERQGIPTRYLEQIFQKLRRAGLVESKRGPGGGYFLARLVESHQSPTTWQVEGSATADENRCNPSESYGAQDWNRTSTPLRELGPEPSASTNSATWAGR